MELEKADYPISVTLVKPAAIDTPFPQHAKNYMTEEPELPAPVYAPEVVAEVILHCAQAPERDMFAGGSAKLHSLEGAYAPRLADRLMEELFFKKQKSGRPATHANEALYAPSSGLRQRSGTRNGARESSLYSRASMHPVLTAAIVAGAGVAVGALLSGAGARE